MVALLAASPLARAADKPADPSSGKSIDLTKSAEPIDGKPIFVLMCAAALLQEGRDALNPLMVGLASVIYFTIGDKQYGLNLLAEATKFARQNKDIKSLRWLADIWGDPVLGAGDADKEKEILADAQNLQEQLAQFRTRGKPMGVKESSLLPAEYQK